MISTPLRAAHHALLRAALALTLVAAVMGPMAPASAIPPTVPVSYVLLMLDIAADGLSWSKSGLAAAAGVSPGVGGASVPIARAVEPVERDERAREHVRENLGHRFGGRGSRRVGFHRAV